MKKDFGVKTWLLPMPVLTDGKPDPDKIAPIAYDPIRRLYRAIGAPVAPAHQESL